MRITRICFYLLLIAVLGACSTPKKIAYFQDAVDGQTVSVMENQAIKLEPEDKLTIVVNSKDQALAEMFNQPMISYRVGAGTSAATQSQYVSLYTVDKNGELDFPVIGKLKVEGKGRQDVAEMIKNELIKRQLIKDPTVTVEYANLAVSVLGEVKNAGRYSLQKDRTSLLDVLGMAGDLTIYGKRENVMILRNENGTQTIHRVDLTSDSSLVNSPVYYLKQNDVVVVEPNTMRARQSTVNGNNVISTSFWVSVASLLTSVSVLIFK